MESNIITFPVKNDYCVQSEPKTDTWADPHEKHAKEWAMYNLYMKIADNNLMKDNNMVLTIAILLSLYLMPFMLH